MQTLHKGFLYFCCCIIQVAANRISFHNTARLYISLDIHQAHADDEKDKWIRLP